MRTIREAQKLFIEDRKFQGLTDNSIQSYIDLFKVWNNWLEENNLERIEELNSKNTKDFLKYCTDKRKNQAKTVNGKLRLLRALAHWLCEEGITEEPFSKGVKLKRESDSPKILLDKDLKDCLEHLKKQYQRDHSFTTRRNIAIIILLAGSGLRLSEMTSLQWTEIDFDNSLIMIRTSKSRKTQSVPLSEQLRGELIDFKHYLQGQFSELPAHLFTTREGNQLSKHSVQTIFKRLKAELNIERDFSAHCMRNYFIKTMLKGANIREVQLLARHSKIDVTKQYVGYFSHELKDTLDRNNPLKGLL
ncbi:tyrosine-type recombinase/integrase [Gracilibacillus lacisalsi]|uniref:tyrosine-type recombinase/integrase n=1 Tax=Gracilibacillus lacisalsi TaxID=393087 RepID=UPI0003786209|nr:site-specific integrase [Gracilibacillus lacisalsi]